MTRADLFGLLLSLAALGSSIFCVVASRNLPHTFVSGNPGGDSGQGSGPGATEAVGPAAALSRDIQALASETARVRSSVSAIMGKPVEPGIDPKTGKPWRFAEGSLHSMVSRMLVTKEAERRTDLIKREIVTQKSAIALTLDNQVKILGLSADQKTRAAEFLTKQIERAGDLRLSNRAWEEIEPELAALDRETTAGYAALLTEEQRKTGAKHIPKSWIKSGPSSRADLHR
ncbi:MAG: hypothetical protein K8T20_07690 [Planctomycetes bacterium]|nr:hypothetical protein [Planctomycetota bacterium]